MTLTYGITVCDELDEFKRLLSNIKRQMSTQDEILVICDNSKGFESKLNQIMNEICVGIDTKFVSTTLNNNFADFKNNLVKFATKDYILQIDADEIMCSNFVPNLKQVLELNPEIDCYTIARENYVTDITDDYLNEQGWYKDEKYRINYPDRQYRLFKNNGKIFWKNKVHEVLYGWRIVANLPDAMSLMHTKTFMKQKLQNIFYAENFKI